MKRRHITEAQLKTIVAESVKKVLKETVMEDNAPTAYYQGREYSVDDELPNDAKISVHYYNSPYAFNAYPNCGESLRDWLESRNESVDDVKEWWME